ncbi:restriction endonuclease [Sorangium sp. So ce834]|uniref:restriction endonuclease n=1 Tax=Sorangium sp. So ce834 TaxID=3133321 RepID=UPI003F60C0E2
MIKQVRIELSEEHSQKEKGDFLEDMFRTLMEKQRYSVVQRIRFTGTEIDLLCDHRDRSDTALVECKARLTVVADDLKNFAYDLLVAKKAGHGYFVHTSELQQNAAGVADELRRGHESLITFIGPEKLMELLQDAGMVARAPELRNPQLVATKLILLYTPRFKAWVHLYAMGAAPSHYSMCSADNSELRSVDADAVLAFLNVDFAPMGHEWADGDVRASFRRRMRCQLHIGAPTASRRHTPPLPPR